MRSISEGIPIDKIADVLTQEEKGKLRAFTESVRLWGTRPTMRNIWKSIREGDHILFVPSGSGFYKFYGEALFISHNAALAQEIENLGIWPEEGRKYEYVFFIDSFREISISKKRINEIIPWGTATPRHFMRVASEIVRDRIIEFLGEEEGKVVEKGEIEENEVSRLRKRILELERELREQREVIRSLKSPPNILTDVELQRLTEHDQIVYKLGLVLTALDFRNIQLDLSSEVDAPPFTAEQKTAFRVKEREYDVKAVYDSDLFAWEVHHRGMLVPTLVKLNELSATSRALVLFSSEDENELRREARRRQFRDLVSVPPFELRKYMKTEIEELYESCKTLYTLKHQIEDQQQKLKEKIQWLDEKRESILHKPSFFEEVF